MNDHDGDEHRIMNHMEEQMGIPPDPEKTAFTLKAEAIALRQSQAIVDLTQNLRLILAEAVHAEYETKELCRELCLTAEFFNKILQSEDFKNIPF